MNVFALQFRILNTGDELFYDALENITDPTYQGWTQVPVTPVAGTAVTEIVPDTAVLSVATTSPADQFMPDSARLNGLATAGGTVELPSRAWFEWGTDINYGNVTTQMPLGPGVIESPFSNVISGLVVGTQYHFRAVVSNDFGIATGIDRTFNLSILRPVAQTQAVLVTNDTTYLRGFVVPRGWPTVAWFEWGSDTNYGNTTPVQNAGSGATGLTISEMIGAMNGHYRVVASNVFGLSAGADKLFSFSFLGESLPGLPDIALSSTAWGDFDGDGRLDLLITGQEYNGDADSQLWRNTGGGFSNVTASIAPGLPGVYFSSVAWGDYDNDGRLDFLITGITNGGSGAISQLWHNTANGFTNVTANVAPGLPAVSHGSVAWGDFDNDGRLDLLITGGSLSNTAQLWRNTASGFSNVTASLAPDLPGFYNSSVAFGDYDSDGRLDFLITGSKSGGPACQLWRNTPSGFSNVTASVAPGLPGVVDGFVSWGDFDNDGRLDFLITGFTLTTNICQLWRNTGGGFSNVTANVAPGLPQAYDSSVAWGDYDNDGRLDFLLVGTTNGNSGALSQLWRNTGSGFSNVSDPVAPYVWGLRKGSATWGDYNNDGRLDFLITGLWIGGAQVSQLWRNNVPASNAPSASPTGLFASVSSGVVSLKWNAPLDNVTPTAGLNYNVRIGTAPGASDVLAPMSLANGLRLLPALGNAQGTNAFYRLRPGTYYWSVQAIDTGFAGSPFAAEQQFTLAAPRTVQPLMLANGHFQFSFSNEASVIFEVLGTTNVSLPLSQWQVLGLPTSLGGGLYRFDDALASNQPRRFYILRAQ